MDLSSGVMVLFVNVATMLLVHYDRPVITLRVERLSNQMKT